MNALILHHFEAFWEKDLLNHGTDLNSEMNKIIDFLMHNRVEKIIVTQFFGTNLSIEHDRLINFCNENNIILENQSYGYGWIRDEYNIDEYPESDLNVTWCNSTREYRSDSDIVLIAPWQHNLKNNFELIYVAGAFYGECVSDLIAALDSINANHKTIEGLIVGAYVDYNWNGFNPEVLHDTIDNKIGLIEDLISEKCDDYDCEETLESLFEKEPHFVKEIEENLNKLIVNEIDNLTLFNIELTSQNSSLQDIINDILSNKKESTIYYDAYNELNRLNIMNIIDSCIPQNNKKALRI